MCERSAIVDAEKHSNEAVVVLHDDHVGVLSRILLTFEGP